MPRPRRWVNRHGKRVKTITGVSYSRTRGRLYIIASGGKRQEFKTWKEARAALATERANSISPEELPRIAAVARHRGDLAREKLYGDAQLGETLSKPRKRRPRSVPCAVPHALIAGHRSEREAVGFMAAWVWAAYLSFERATTSVNCGRCESRKKRSGGLPQAARVYRWCRPPTRGILSGFVLAAKLAPGIHGSEYNSFIPQWLRADERCARIAGPEQPAGILWLEWEEAARYLESPRTATESSPAMPSITAA